MTGMHVSLLNRKEKICNKKLQQNAAYCLPTPFFPYSLLKGTYFLFSFIRCQVRNMIREGSPSPGLMG